ncbi:hypothetical protein Dimus_017348, partial [Dionaea muscipula]
MRICLVPLPRLVFSEPLLGDPVQTGLPGGPVRRALSVNPAWRALPAGGLIRRALPGVSARLSVLLGSQGRNGGTEEEENSGDCWGVIMLSCVGRNASNDDSTPQR